MKKRGQIWVETVIYTLIAFAMVGLVLSYARPQIEKLQDKAVIEQSITMMKNIDTTILNMMGAGNQRIIELGIKKGDLKMDGINDLLEFEIESRYTFSEPDIIINDGDIEIITQKSGKFNLVKLKRDYSAEYNITYEGDDKAKIISKSSVAYKIKVSNNGRGTFEEGTCTTVDDCADKQGHSKECVSGNCKYTENRIKINFELM